MNVSEKDVLLCKALARVTRAMFVIEKYRDKTHGPTEALAQADTNLRVAAKALHEAFAVSDARGES